MWVRLIEISCCTAPAHGGTCENAVHCPAGRLPERLQVWRGAQVSASGRQEALVLLLLTPASRQVRAQWEAGPVNRGFISLLVASWAGGAVPCSQDGLRRWLVMSPNSDPGLGAVGFLLGLGISWV